MDLITTYPHGLDYYISTWTRLLHIHTDLITTYPHRLDYYISTQT